MSRYKAIDMNRVKTYSIKNRKSKVALQGFAGLYDPDQDSFERFYKSLPRYLAVKDLDTLVHRICDAKNKDKPVLLMMGAHVLKTGLNPVIIDLMKKGFIQGAATNGACAVHDAELAYFGQTSEDVSAALKDGTFGMAEETARIVNEAAITARKEELGFGEALGRRINRDSPEFASVSLFGAAYEESVPATIHVALGTDIVHQHPNADGAAIGDASLRDFRIFARLVTELNNGGVLLHIGSAVLLPEVFLKALTTARNIAGEVRNFTTANFDMFSHYRPTMNIVKRPVEAGGTGFTFTGHHEIMLPLLAAAIKMRSKQG